MTLEEKIAMVKAMTGETDESVVTAYLMLSGDKIIHKAYPFHPDMTEVPTRYDVLQCEIATYLLNKRGAEGQTSHDENGINRTYESASVPDSMLDAVTPYIRAFGDEE